MHSELKGRIQAMRARLDGRTPVAEIRASSQLFVTPDLRHIQHALTLLESGGILTAVCLNGPRQQKILRPLSDVWEPLPRGTFTNTDVSTVLLRIQN